MDFHPDLLPQIRKLEIHAKRDVLSRSLTGNWLSKIKGRGIEFSGYRQYTSGDDAGLIDWKASMRARKLLVKELNEEKSLNIFILLDVSDTMLFGTTEKLKAEYAAELISSLSFAALRGGENIGVALWSDKIKRYLPLKQGLASHALISKAMSNTSFYGGHKDFAKTSAHMLSLMGVPGLIIIVSDFIGYDEVWEHHLKIMAKKHDLLCIVVRDPRDRHLPEKGEYILQDPSTGQKLVVDAADYAEPYKAYVRAEEERLRVLLNHAHADMLLLETSDDYSKALTRFFIIHNKKVNE